MQSAILVNHIVKPVELMEWAEWFETANRIVKQETLSNKLRVSTVFLGLNHNFGIWKPLWFETMVFPEKDMGDLDMDRYTTWEEAEKGHKKMVKKWSKK